MALIASISRRELLVGATAATAQLATPAIVHAQPKALRIGVLLPRSGYMAPTGQASHRGAMIAPKVLADYGHRVELIHIDTESNVDAARIAAQRIINDGAHCIVGNVDSGGTRRRTGLRTAPCMVNVGAAPQITEQGFKFVARNFPHAGMLMETAFGSLRLKSPGSMPRRRSSYANDTFGQAQRNALDALFPRAGLPFQVVDHIAFDPRAGSFGGSHQDPRVQPRYRDGGHARQRRGQAHPRYGAPALPAEGDHLAWLLRNVRGGILKRSARSPTTRSSTCRGLIQSPRWLRRWKLNSSRRFRTSASRLNAFTSAPSKPCWSQPMRSRGQDTNEPADS